MQSKSIVLLSGGLDSALSLVTALAESTVKYALTFDYQQRCATREINAARSICTHLGIEHKTVPLPFFPTSATHPLFGEENRCPTLAIDQLDDPALTQKSAKAVWVPNRNGIFLNIAAALAEAKDLGLIYTGFNAEEAATFPDNSAEFVDALNRSLSYSTLSQIKVRCPTIRMRKTEILQGLVYRDFPLHLLWSCYNNHEKMCGLCESCLRLKRAMMANGLKEPMVRLFENEMEN